MNLQVGSCKLTYRMADALPVFGKTVKFKKPYPVPILTIGGETMMSVTPQEIAMMEKDAKKAHGSALIAGLGLGVILDAIRKKCKHVSVVEKNKDVVEIYKKFKGGKVAYNSIYVDTIENWLAEFTEEKFDFIYLDTWYNGDYECLPHINWLIAECRSRLNKGGAVKAWAYDDMVRSFERDCKGLVIRHATSVKRVKRDRIEILKAVYPMIGAFMEWFKAANPPDWSFCKGTVNRIAGKVERSSVPIDVSHHIRTIKALHCGIQVGVTG